MLAVRDHPRGTLVGSANCSRRRSRRIGIDIRSAIWLRLRNEAWSGNWSDLRHGDACRWKSRLHQHRNRLSGSCDRDWNQSRRSHDGGRRGWRCHSCNRSRSRNRLRNGRGHRLSRSDKLLELNGRGRCGSGLSRRRWLRRNQLRMAVLPRHGLHGSSLRHRNRLDDRLRDGKSLGQHLSGQNLSRRDRINAQHSGRSEGRWRLIPRQGRRMNPGAGRVRSQSDHRNCAGRTSPFGGWFGRACGHGWGCRNGYRRDGDRSVSGNGNKAVSRHRRCPVSLPVALAAHHRTAV